KLAGLINMPLMVLNKVCAPRFSRLYWEQKRSELQKYIAQVTMFAFYGALLIGVGLFFLSDYILAVFGQEFLQAYDLLLVLMIGQIVSCASGSVGVFMLMTGNEKAYRNITLLTAAGAFLAYIVVLPVHGLMGAALISSFSLIILNGISVLYIRIRLGYLTLYLPLLGRFLKTGYEKT